MDKTFLSEKDKIQIKNMRLNGYKIEDIAKKFNKRDKIISKYLKEEKIPKPITNIQFSIDEIDDIINMYKEGISSNKILLKYNHKIKSEHTIIKILKKNNVEIRSRGKVPSIKNNDFFNKIDNEEKAYILGLMISDGYVIYPKGKGTVVGITLNINDIDLLEKIKSIWETDVKIIIHRENEAILSIRSNEMAEDLKKYTVTNRKSFTVELPFDEIPEELMHHLIRGIFDGDGTIFINQKGYSYFGFYGNEKIVNQIQNYLLEKINITKTKITNQKNNNVSFFQNGHINDLKKFYNYIYEDSNIYMERKKEKFEEYFKLKNIVV